MFDTSPNCSQPVGLRDGDGKGGIKPGYSDLGTTQLYCMPFKATFRFLMAIFQQGDTESIFLSMPERQLRTNKMWIQTPTREQK